MKLYWIHSQPYGNKQKVNYTDLKLKSDNTGTVIVLDEMTDTIIALDERTDTVIALDKKYIKLFEYWVFFIIESNSLDPDQA